jgi:hypothetical protein
VDRTICSPAGGWTLRADAIPPEVRCVGGKAGSAIGAPPRPATTIAPFNLGFGVWGGFSVGGGFGTIVPGTVQTPSEAVRYD